MDTQWPRFEVFEQERPGRPHVNAGAVHAPDAEMALQNARDVFVRRPDCYSLWVAPASAIYSRTAEELAAEAAASALPGGAVAEAETYQVFRKVTQRQGETFVTHAGAVQARSPAEALARAREQFAEMAAFVWWVIPDRAINRSDAADASTLFGPARDKTFRMPNFYRVQTLMRQATATGDELDLPGEDSAACPAGVPPPREPSADEAGVDEPASGAAGEAEP